MNEEKYICHRCVGEEYVRLVIKKTGNANNDCNYCGRKLKSIKLEVLAEMVHNVFIEYYEQPDDGEFYNDSGDTATSIIQDELIIEEEPADDIFNVMQDIYNDYHGIDVVYDECFNYVRVNRVNNSLGWAWEKMEQSLKSEALYFNKHVKEFLDELFSDIERMRTGESRQAINDVGGDVIFYRARAFENYEDVQEALEHPERYFGPPPQALARSGRMNAHGIPVFYGATSPSIAVSEIRPVVGNFVVVVPFRPIRNLKILDISALNDLSNIKGSIFDPYVTGHNEKVSFMRTLARKLTMPVSGRKPEDEYLITQAVSEYLALSDKFSLDGISFESTQHSGDEPEDIGHHNVVLFRKSSRILNSESNEKSFQVDLFENVEDDNYIFSPAIHPINKNKTRRTLSSSFSIDKHLCALELMPDGIVFHRVKGVKYYTDSIDVKSDGML